MICLVVVIQEVRFMRREIQGVKTDILFTRGIQTTAKTELTGSSAQGRLWQKDRAVFSTRQAPHWYIYPTVKFIVKEFQ